MEGTSATHSVECGGTAVWGNSIRSVVKVVTVK